MPSRAIVVLSTGLDGSHAIAVLETPDGSLRSHDVSGRGTGRPTHQRLVLDAFEWLYAQCRDLPGEPVDTYVAYVPIRRELALLAPSFPRVRLLEEPTAAHVALIATVSSSPPDTPQAASRPVPMRRPEAAAPDRPCRVVATDASLARRRTGAGIACVDAEGTFAQGIARTSSIAIAELSAIELAVRTFPRGDLLVLSDSRPALAWLADPDRVTDPHLQHLLAAIRTGSAGRRVRFDWVKGHDGHRLNETADRLAMAARRAREFQQDEAVRKRIAASIIGDLIAA